MSRGFGGSSIGYTGSVSGVSNSSKYGNNTVDMFSKNLSRRKLIKNEFSSKS